MPLTSARRDSPPVVEAPAGPPEKQLLTRREVCYVTGLGRTTISKLMADPRPEVRFPAAIKFGDKSRWSVREVHAWIEARIASRGVRS